MLKLHGDLLALYFASAFGGFILLMLAGVPLIFPLLLLSVLWIFISGIGAVLLATRRHNRVEKQRQNCHVGEYIAFYERLFVKKAALKNTTLRNLLLINLSAGYAVIGNPVLAIQLLRQVTPPLKDNKAAAVHRLVYCNNMAVCYLQLHDPVNATAALKDMEQLLASVKLPDLQRQQLFFPHTQNRAELALEQGHIQEAATLLDSLLPQAHTPLQQVSIHFQLARICVLKGQYDAALPHLQFVLQSGGDTYYVREAKTILQQMQDA